VHKLHTLAAHNANRLHVFDNIVSAINPLLTEHVLTIMYKITTTKTENYYAYVEYGAVQ